MDGCDAFACCRAAGIVTAPLVKLDMRWAEGRPYVVVAVPQLAPASTHMFRVTAMNALGPSIVSAPSHSAIVRSDRPDPPRITFLQVLPPSSVVFEFSVFDCHGAPAKSFEVEMRELVTRPGDVPCGPGEEDADGHMFTDWRLVCAVDNTLQHAT